jgi:hypothetical protein
MSGHDFEMFPSMIAISAAVDWAVIASSIGFKVVSDNAVSDQNQTHHRQIRMVHTSVWRKAG